MRATSSLKMHSCEREGYVRPLHEPTRDKIPSPRPSPRRTGRGRRSTADGAGVECAKEFLGSINLRNGRANAGFTLIELLVVLGCLALLSTLILPGLAARQPMTQTMQCGNNLRQLTLAWQMYAQDNADRVVTPALAVAGVMGWTASSTDNTNVSELFDPASSVLSSYISRADKCFQMSGGLFSIARCSGAAGAQLFAGRIAGRLCQKYHKSNCRADLLCGA